MTRRTPEMFSLSFLDLITGALGALLVVYLITPKLKNPHAEIAEKIKEARQAISSAQENSNQGQPNNEQRKSIQASLETAQQKLQEIDSIAARMRDEIGSQKAEIETLKKGLGECQNELKNSAFLVLSVKWDTEAQDVDLWVEDPAGFNYSYLEKSHPNRRGLLSADTTVGPGVEVWETLQPYPGKYRVYINLFARNQNPASPSVKLRVFYNRGAAESRSVTLALENSGNSKEQMTLLMTLDVAEDGSIRFRE